jgi:hypothetical protein
LSNSILLRHFPCKNGRVGTRFPTKVKDEAAAAWEVHTSQEIRVKKKRNRSRPVLSLQERLKQFASRAREKADDLPPCPERDHLMRTAVSSEAAAAIDRWLTSPGLQSQK